MSIAETLKKAGAKSTLKKKAAPLWEGPHSSSRNGGCSQSLLCRFLTCRERFRLLTMEGLRSDEGFSHYLEFGNAWHICEEALASLPVGMVMPDISVTTALMRYCQKLCKVYPMQQAQVDKWYNVIKQQFPVYIDYWLKHKDVKDRTPVFQEKMFCVPLTLPSGRVVYIKGKMDAVDLIGKGKASGLYLQENKTKSNPNEIQIKRQMLFDLQTMTYTVALERLREMILNDEEDGDKEVFSKPILGVRYNVIRRPLSGGKGSIVQHKPTKKNPKGESKADYYARLGGIIKAAPQDFFMRWKVEVSKGDIVKFRDQCLDPILEQLCDWWEWISGATERGCNIWDNDIHFQGEPWGDNKGHASAIHWRHPFGIRNILDDGGSSDVDAYLESGSVIGLTRTDTLFPELEPVTVE